MKKGCEFCKKEKIIFNKKLNLVPWWFLEGNIITKDHIGGDEKNLGVLIDRGCLRFVDLDDYNCMDHGQNIKINYCPFCGERIKQ